MTSSVATPETETSQKPVWEDLLDIFYAPSAVFDRRRDGRFGLAFIVLTALFTFLAISAHSVLAPLYEAEFNRGLAMALEANPEVPLEQLEMARKITGITAIVSTALFVPIAALLVGLGVKIMGSLVNATLTFKLSVLIAIYAQFPRALQQLLSVVQGFALPAESLTSRFAIGFSPARFMDIDTTGPSLLALLERFDLFTIWSVVLVAIGIRVIGKVPAGRAALAAALIWVLGTLPSLLGMLRA